MQKSYFNVLNNRIGSTLEFWGFVSILTPSLLCL